MSLPIQESIQTVKKVRTRQYRNETGLTIVEGLPEVRRMLKAGIEPDALFICDEILGEAAEEFKAISSVKVSKDVFSQIAFGKRLKGILALCRPHVYRLSDIKPRSGSFFIVLEGVEKPGNLGAVVRSADGAGVDAVIITQAKTDIYNHNVVRASIGTVFMCPVIDATQEELQAFFRQYDISIVVATAKANDHYTEIDYTQSTAVVVGNEHFGVSSFWINQDTKQILIPMLGEGRCLNAAMSASIIMYEARRQKGFHFNGKEVYDRKK